MCAGQARCKLVLTIFFLCLSQVMEQNYTNTREFTCAELHEYIDTLCTTCFQHEDPFEAIVIFLHTSIEVRYRDCRLMNVLIIFQMCLKRASLFL